MSTVLDAPVPERESHDWAFQPEDPGLELLDNISPDTSGRQHRTKSFAATPGHHASCSFLESWDAVKASRFVQVVELAAFLRTDGNSFLGKSPAILTPPPTCTNVNLSMPKLMHPIETRYHTVLKKLSYASSGTMLQVRPDFLSGRPRYPGALMSRLIIARLSSIYVLATTTTSMHEALLTTRVSFNAFLHRDWLSVLCEEEELRSWILYAMLIRKVSRKLWALHEDEVDYCGSFNLFLDLKRALSLWRWVDMNIVTSSVVKPVRGDLPKMETESRNVVDDADG